MSSPLQKDLPPNYTLHWESSIDIYTPPCVTQRASVKLLESVCSVMTERGGGMGKWEGGDICVHIADSLCCTAETNTTL